MTRGIGAPRPPLRFRERSNLAHWAGFWPEAPSWHGISSEGVARDRFIGGTLRRALSILCKGANGSAE